MSSTPIRINLHGFPARLRAWSGNGGAWTLALSLLAMAALFVLPSGVESRLDGLPLSQPGEAFAALAILPMLLLLGWRFLRFHGAAALLVGLLLIKLCLFVAAPQAGLRMWSYESKAALEQDQWRPTWESVWHPGQSTIMTRKFDDPHYFPLEWLNNLYFKNETKKGLQPYIRLEGYVRLAPGERLLVLGRGMVWQEFQAIREGGDSTSLAVIPEAKQAAGISPERLPQGDLALKGTMQFGPLHRRGWHLDICTMDQQGRVRSAFGRGILWADEAGLELGRTASWFMRAAAQFTGLGLAAFLGLWALWCLYDLVRSRALEERTLLALGAAWFVYWLLLELGAHPLTVMGRSLAWSLGIYALLLFLPWPRLRLDPGKIALALLLIVGPVMLFDFYQKWWFEPGRFKIFEDGQDWLIYQAFAREIVLTQDFWQTNRLVLYNQPLYRYLVALGHLIFGQSNLALDFLDVWTVITAACLLPWMALRLNLALPLAVGAAGLYLQYDLTDRFLLHIGRGLQEHASLLFMLLAIWAIFRRREGPLGWVLAAGLLAGVSLIIRLDRLGAVVPLALYFVPICYGGFRQAWRDQTIHVLRGWFNPSLFWLILALFLGLLVLRNGLIGDTWVVLDSKVAGYTYKGPMNAFNNLQRLLNGGNDRILISARLLWPGAILAMLSLFVRWGPMRHYPLTLGLTITGLISPYLVTMGSAYAPRFSVHLLPMAALSIMTGLNALWLWLRPKLPQRYLEPWQKNSQA